MLDRRQVGYRREVREREIALPARLGCPAGCSGVVPLPCPARSGRATGTWGARGAQGARGIR